MKITDLLKANAIDLNVTATSKEDVLTKAVDLMAKSGNITDKDEYLKAVFAREEESTTGVGEGIAIPHGRCAGVAAPGLAAMVIPAGVDYAALDDEPVNLLFLIAANPQSGSAHIDILSKLSGMLMNDDFTAALKKAKTPEEFLKIIDDAEDEKDAAVAAKETAAAPSKMILAVTACPTGIAHTYMAAEAIEKAGKKLGIPVKVETNGSGGAKNVLTAEEIANAEGIIIAADKAVEMSRFDGKKLISTKVSDGIKKPEELLNAVKDAPVYHHTGAKVAANSGAPESFGRKVYKHLMNGVSNMLPFVVAGGIFIAIAFLIDTLTGAPTDGGFGSYNEVARWFKSVGGVAFDYMLPILAAFIAYSIADRPGFLVGMVGGYMASVGSTFDLIGPADRAKPGFLGALIAGFLGGLLILGVEKLCDKLPKALNGIKPVLIYPLAGLLLVAVMMCLVNPSVGGINEWLNGRLAAMGGSSKILLGLVLGGMMSIDMGGPFNKAAYVFGTASITAGNYDIMAAVMIGGMVPPIAIALSTILFKSKFNEEERKSGPVNFIMGLSFITEGAIPYAAADPLRVIFSCMVGSGLAGALSMAFGCTLMAPHGGVFVFAVVGNWAMYVVSLLVGSIVGAVLMGLLKKKVVEE